MDLRIRDQRPSGVPNSNTTCSSCCCCNIVVGGNSDRVLKRWFGNEATARGGNRVEDSLLGGVWGSDLWVQMGDLVVLVVRMWVLNIHGSCWLCRGCVCVCVYVCERTCGGGGWCCGGGGGSGLLGGGCRLLGGGGSRLLGSGCRLLRGGG